MTKLNLAKGIIFFLLICQAIALKSNTVQFELEHSLPDSSSRGTIEFSLEEVSEKIQTTHIIDDLAQIKQKSFSQDQIEKVNYIYLHYIRVFLTTAKKKKRYLLCANKTHTIQSKSQNKTFKLQSGHAT